MRKFRGIPTRYVHVRARKMEKYVPDRTKIRTWNHLNSIIHSRRGLSTKILSNFCHQRTKTVFRIRDARASDGKICPRPGQNLNQNLLGFDYSVNKGSLHVKFFQFRHSNDLDKFSPDISIAQAQYNVTWDEQNKKLQQKEPKLRIKNLKEKNSKSTPV
jgi:hypothetical protein